MAGITIHQRVHGYLWNWNTGPGWARDGAEIHKLRLDGMRVLKVQAQDNGPIPVDQAKEWVDAGMQVWLMFRPSHSPLHDGTWEPEETAQFAKDEQKRLAAGGVTVRGMDFNFELEINAKDAEMGGQWSERFCKRFREIAPTIPAHLDSYWGPMGDKLNLNAYLSRGFRPTVQTFWADGIWDDPPTNMVQKGLGAQPVIPKSAIKPIFRVSPNNQGQLPFWPDAFSDTAAAGTKGCSLYPIEGAPDFELLRWLIREIIKRGLAY